MTEDQAEKRGRRARQAKEPKAPKESSGSPLAGFRQWLSDSYNGLFKIVIQPQLPKPRVLGFMVASFLFGMIWAYLLAPTVFYNGAPNQMSSAQQDQYVRLIAGSYQAGVYDDGQTQALLNRVDEPGARVERLIQQESGQVQSSLQAILPLAQGAEGTPIARDGGIVRSILTFVIAVIAFIIIANVAALLWGLLIGGFVQRGLARLRPKTEADLDAQRTMEAIRERKRIEGELKEKMAQQNAASDFGPPMMNKISVYTKGRQFDDSFAIEDANDMFLGECGATIAKTIGDTGELAAVEIWLFDKEDFVRTLTKTFVTEHAFNDPVSRSELDAKVDNPATDLIVFRPGAVLILETNTLRLQARVEDMAYGTNPALPPNSYIEKLTLSLSAWEKAKIGASAGAPAGIPAGVGAVPAPATPVPAYNPPPAPAPTYAPPPTPTPGYNPPPAAPFGGGATRPATPPPPPSFPGRKDDDDPFGGTGDFTPIGG
ncbi:MAG: hypothetical protein SF029_04350 [bacterium]|nr:hypothetical protein [bacterium]